MKTDSCITMPGRCLLLPSPSFAGNPLCAVCCHPNRLNLEMQFASDALDGMCSSGWKSDDSMRLLQLRLCDYDSIIVGASRIHCVART